MDSGGSQSALALVMDMDAALAHSSPEDTDKSPKLFRIERIVTQREQECVEIDKEIQKKSEFIQSCIDDLEDIAKTEMIAIDAQIAALIQEREEAEGRNSKYKEEIRNLGENLLSPLKERKESLERLNALQRSLTAPVTKLPVELLGYIFNFYVEMDESPWLLALVSPMWRRIALSMPKLWRYILVTNSTPSEVQKDWDIGGEIGRVTSYRQYTKCVTEAELVQVLALSGTVPLRVSLNLYGDPGFEGQYSESLAQLFRLPTSNRIEDIKIELSGFSDSRPFPLSGYMQQSYPRLRSLTFWKTSSNWDVDFMLNLLSSSELDTVTLKSFLPSEIIASPGWASVRHLTLPYGMLPSVLNDFCTSIQNIQTLKPLPNNWPNGTTPKIAFKLLTELDINCEAAHLHRLILPSLTKLKLVVRAWDDAVGTPPSWNLPALSEFHGTFNETEAAKYLPSIKMPRLKTLSLVISRNGGWSASPSVFPSIIYPTVETLSFGGSVSSDYFVGALKAAPNAEKAVISPTRDHKYYLRTILTEMTDMANNILPRASELHFGTKGVPFFTPKRPLPSLCKRCVANRKALSRQPFEIVVTTSNRRDYTTSTEIFS